MQDQESKDLQIPRRVKMSKPTSAGDAFRDLFRAHARRLYIWLPLLLVAIAAGTTALQVRDIMLVRPDLGVVPPELRSSFAYEAVLCRAVSTVCAYVGGFVVRRLYEPSV
jgi:hypothetical protein